LPSPIEHKLLNCDNAIMSLDIGQASDHKHLTIIATQVLTDFVIKRPGSRLPASGPALGGGTLGSARIDEAAH
jgi:hypothetical protein